jgi:MFS transporter, putative metabolite transport protein
VAQMLRVRPIWARSMTNLGVSATMLIAAGIAAVGAALSQWLAPETKGKSLTETAAVFAH